MSHANRLHTLIDELTVIAEELTEAEPEVVVPEGTEVLIHLEASTPVDGEFYIDVILTDIDEEDRFVSLGLDANWDGEGLEFIGHDTSQEGIWNTPGWFYRSNPAIARAGAFASARAAIQAQGLVTRLNFKATGPVDTVVRIDNFQIHSVKYAKLVVFPEVPEIAIKF